MSTAHLVPPAGGTSWDVAGERITCKADVELVDAHLQLFVVQAVRGAGSIAHRHPWDEIVVVSDGELELCIDDDVRTVGPGWVGIVPAGTAHAWRTISETSRYFVVASGDGAGERYADLHEPD